MNLSVSREAWTIRRSRWRISTQRSLTAYLLLLPGLIFYVPFHFLPILGVFFFSFLDWKGFSFATMKWAGLANYTKMLNDKFFWGALKHNIQFVVVVIIVQTVLALALALILEQKFHLSTFFRGVYFMPTVLSLVVVGILFSFILSPSQGLINVFLRNIGLGKVQPVWLGDPGLALYVLMAVHMWKDFGLSMFLFIAGLEAIPEELFDAAKVDGATPWDIIWRIIIPLLRETTTVVIILITIVCFKLFDMIVVMTGGGPFFATEVLSVRMYYQTFKFNRMGYGSAIAVILFLITFVVSAIQFWLRTKGEKVEY
jgi:raffinose/stachyose/melibiose transport system permease protein